MKPRVAAGEEKTEGAADVVTVVLPPGGEESTDPAAESHTSPPGGVPAEKAGEGKEQGLSFLSN